MQLGITIARSMAILALLALGGCSVYSLPGQEPESAPVEPAPAPDYRSESPATSATPPAATAEPGASAHSPLLARADEAVARGDYDQALALLERAQRIDPDNGEIYLELSRTYAARGDWEMSRATAQRGLLYCDNRRQCDALRGLSGS